MDRFCYNPRFYFSETENNSTWMVIFVVAGVEKVKKDKRFSWILTSLNVVGGFDRKNYQTVFEISESQITQDLDGFCKRFNEEKSAFCEHITMESKRGLLFRNRVTKEVSGDAKLFWPFGIDGLTPMPVDEWFAMSHGDLFVDVQDHIEAPTNSDILNQVVRALSSSSRVRVDYDSPSSGRRVRTVSFLQLVRAVGRLHVHAFDHDKNVFCDFALGRMMAIEMTKEDSFVLTSSPLVSEHMSQTTDLVLSLNKDLSAASRRAISRVYGTKPHANVVFHNIPQHLIPYAKQSLGLFPEEYGAGYFVPSTKPHK